MFSCAKVAYDLRRCIYAQPFYGYKCMQYIQTLVFCTVWAPLTPYVCGIRNILILIKIPSFGINTHLGQVNCGFGFCHHEGNEKLKALVWTSEQTCWKPPNVLHLFALHGKVLSVICQWWVAFSVWKVDYRKTSQNLNPLTTNQIKIVYYRFIDLALFVIHAFWF